MSATAIADEDVERRLRKCLILFTEKYYPDMAKMLKKCAEKLEQSKGNPKEPQKDLETLNEETETEMEPPIQPEPVKEDSTPKPPITCPSNIPSNCGKNDHLKNCLLDLAKKYHPNLAECIGKCIEEKDQVQPSPKPDSTSVTPVDPIVTPPIRPPTPKPTPDSEERKQMKGCLVRVAELYHPKLANCLLCFDPSTATSPSTEDFSKEQQLKTCLLQFADKYHPDLAKCIEECVHNIEQPQDTTETTNQGNSREKLPTKPTNSETQSLPSPQSTDYNVEQDLKICLVEFAEKCNPQFGSYISQCAKKLEQSQELKKTRESASPPPVSAQPKDTYPKPIDSKASSQKGSELESCLLKFAEKYHPELAKRIARCVERLEKLQRDPAQPPIQATEPMRNPPMAENAKKDIQLQKYLLRFTEKYHPKLAVHIGKCVDKLEKSPNKQASDVNTAEDSSDEDLHLCLLSFAKQYHPELAKRLRACVEKMDQDQTRKASAGPVDPSEIEEENKLLQDLLLQLTKMHQPEFAKLIEEDLASENTPTADQNPPSAEVNHKIEKEKEILQKCLVQLTKLHQPDLADLIEKDLEEQQQTGTKLVEAVPKEPPNDSEPFATEETPESSKGPLDCAVMGSPIRESLERIAGDLYPDLTLCMGQCVALGEDSSTELASPESTPHKMRIYLDDMENLAKVSVFPTGSQETEMEKVIIETPMAAVAKESELSPVDVEFIMERQSAATSPEAKKKDLLNSVIVILKHIWPDLMESLRREMMEETNDVE